MSFTKYGVAAILCLMIVLAYSPGTYADTYVEGDVWGTWYADSSAYIVTDSVRIPPCSTLTIEPGVEIKFFGHYKFIVDSCSVLQAVGTEQDSIVFTEYFPGNGWHGIRFLQASSLSQVSYCRLEYGKATESGDDVRGGAIYCSNTSPTISNNQFFDNNAQYGGAIHCDNSRPLISDNHFSDNDAQGGAIYCANGSSPTISGNTFTFNYGYNGGTIYCDYSSPHISHNTFAGNSSTYGGAIYCEYSSPTISENTFTDNSISIWMGGAIYCDYSSPTISYNAFSYNSANFGFGGAIYCTYSDPIIRDNTFTENSASNGGAIS